MSGYNRLGEYLHLGIQGSQPVRITIASHSRLLRPEAISQTPCRFLLGYQILHIAALRTGPATFAFLVTRAFVRCISLSPLPYHTAHSPLIEHTHRRGPSVRDGSKTPRSRAYTFARASARGLPARRQLWLPRRAARDPHGTKHDASRGFRR